MGFKDGLEGKKALLSPKKAKKFRDRFYEKKLAYGEHGSGKKIEPNVALIYEIELLAIENPKFKR